MKYKRSEFYNILNKNDENDEFAKNFRAAKKSNKNNTIKYKIKRKRTFWIRLILLLLILIGAVVICFFYFFGGIKKDVNFDKSNEALGLDISDKIDNSVTNIAVFGLDKRKNENVGRSDAIMVVSFDGVHKKIKIVSILRDTRLPIDGHGRNKLGHAFAYGGPNLAVKTLNKNFGLDIRNYVAINFSQMIHIIDAFGGVDVKIKKEQVKEINGIINSTPEYRKSKMLAPFKEESKVVHLNGAQALSYARMRKKDDEHHRATRQQIIMNLLLDKFTKIPKKDYPGLLRRLVPFLETSLGMRDILGFLPFVLHGKPTLQRDIIPHINDKSLQYGYINGAWCWQYDLKKYSKILHKFIYEK